MSIEEKIANAKETDWLSEGFSEDELKIIVDSAKTSAQIDKNRVDIQEALRHQIINMCNTCKHQSNFYRNCWDNTYICNFYKYNPALIYSKAVKTNEIKCDQYEYEEK